MNLYSRYKSTTVYFYFVLFLFIIVKLQFGLYRDINFAYFQPVSNKHTISFSRAIQGISFRNNVHTFIKNTQSPGCTTSLSSLWIHCCSQHFVCCLVCIFLAHTGLFLIFFTTFYKLGTLCVVPTRAFIV